MGSRRIIRILLASVAIGVLCALHGIGPGTGGLLAALWTITFDRPLANTQGRSGIGRRIGSAISRIRYARCCQISGCTEHDHYSRAIELLESIKEEVSGNGK